MVFWGTGVRRFPILQALLAQGLMLALLFLVLQALQGFGVRLPLWSALLLQGGGAALLGAWLGLSRWWLPINLGFVPALWLVQSLAVPAWLPLLAFALLLLLNWNSARERVPLYLTGPATRAALAELLAERAPAFRFVDLGCGLGSALCPLARRFPQAQFLGVETAPLSFLLAWLRSLPLGNCRVRYRSLWQVPLGDFDVVYCFLSPQPMPALWDKARREMAAGSWLISNSFAIPAVTPSRRLELDDWRSSQLLLWQVPATPVALAAAPGQG